MTIRHALVAVLFAMGLMLLLLLPSPRPAAVLAQEPPLRATPTPVHPKEETILTPDMLEEGNNPPLPDLIVSGIQVYPNPPLVNRPVTFEITIANIGEVPVADTNNFFVDLYINPETPPRACTPGDFYFPVQGFEVGSGQHTLRVTFNPDDPDSPAAVFRDVGIVTVWAQVDNATDAGNDLCGSVVESRENNNILATAVDVETRYDWFQTEHEDFQKGFSSALDLTHPMGVLQNGTGWFYEPRFPQPEDPEWTVDPVAPWDSATFYNPDLHVQTNNLPDYYPTDQLDSWNPPDQENLDIQAGYGQNQLFAVWEDATCGDLTDRDIYFSYGQSDDLEGRGPFTWSEPIRINRDKPAPGDPDYDPNNPCAGPINNQLHPQLVVDYEAQRLFVFWQDERLGNYDIYFARALTAFPINAQDWVEPDSNPVNDKNIDPNADQINVTAAAFHEVVEGTPAPTVEACAYGSDEPTHLYVAWEDYRNGNADIFFEWSRNCGDRWLKTEDPNPSTINADIHVQPDPTTNAGIFDQRKPHLTLERRSSETPINYCEKPIPAYVGLDDEDPIRFHPYHQNPLPRVFISWEDVRNIVSGDQSTVFYTRGEFYFDSLVGSGDCDNYSAAPNLPSYRFEDDHVAVSGDTGTASQLEPTSGFNPDGIYEDVAYNQQVMSDPYVIPAGEIITTDEITASLYFTVTYIFDCQIDWQVEELVVVWQDDRNGTFDIWAGNLIDDIPPFPTFVLLGQVPPLLTSSSFEVSSESTIPPTFDILEELQAQLAAGNLAEVFNPPYLNGQEDAEQACLSREQGGLGESDPPTIIPPEIERNDHPNSPQPLAFYELSFPQSELEISDANTFTPKPLCQAPDEPEWYPVEPSDQTKPDVVVLPGGETTAWSAWEDTRAYDESNQDIFLGPVIRPVNSLTLTVFNSEGGRLATKVVQDNVKNQITLRRWDLYDEYAPASVAQFNPTLTYYPLGGGSPIYVGWEDNRNANPLIGFEGNKDIFAAHMILTDSGERPTRSGTFISSVYGTGANVLTWYDIDWWGDISVDGVLVLQTRFGLDPDQPEPPQENVAANGWTQWTGIGGTGGFYDAPGQHIAGPSGERFPTSYYVQYRVIFNPQEQNGIICLTEVVLNFEKQELTLHLPLIFKSGDSGNGGGGTSGSVSGTVVDAVSGVPISGALVCIQSSNQCGTTTSTGGYQINAVAGGGQTLEVTASGYIPTQIPITINGGQSTQQNAALSPLLGAGEMRMVLTWGEHPWDLDSHLWLPPSEPYHLYYLQSGTCDTFPFACLDIDDVISYGPETVTLSQRQNGSYLYAVHRYAGAGTINTSGARVQVYSDTGLVAEFTPPASGEGDWWYIFDMDGSTGAITPHNVIQPNSPAPYGAVEPLGASEQGK